VRQCVGGQIGHGAAGLLHYIVLGCAALGHHVARGVGDIEEYVGDLLLDGVELVGEILLGSLALGHECLGLLGLLALAFFHVGADGGGEFVELGSLGVALELESTATVVELDDAGYDFAGVEALDGEALDDPLGGRLLSVEG